MERTERSTEPVPEVPVRLWVNGSPVAVWTCSPVALDALGAGRLLALGYVRDSRDLLGVAVPPAEEGVHRIEVEVAPDRVSAAVDEREHRREHGCGLRFLVGCRPDLLPSRSSAPPPLPEPGAFPALFRELFDRSPTRKTTGGHHTTALVDAHRLLHVHEEVGRHNGADKAIGSALLEGGALAGLGLLTTARISGEIAEKAARAGLAWVASRSVPTTMAVEIAGATGLALVARAPGRDARVFR